MNLDEKLSTIIETYGVSEQREHLLQEVREFLDEVLLFEAGVGDIKKLEEEFADVSNMVREFELYYEINQEEKERNMTLKADRQLERIARGE